MLDGCLQITGHVTSHDYVPRWHVTSKLNDVMITYKIINLISHTLAACPVVGVRYFAKKACRPLHFALTASRGVEEYSNRESLT